MLACGNWRIAGDCRPARRRRWARAPVRDDELSVAARAKITISPAVLLMAAFQSGPGHD